MARGVVRIGTSGWQYDHWRGRFYLEGLPKRDWLGHYSRQFAAVEVNGTFYGLPKPERAIDWRETVPPGFRFCCKYSRYGSHQKKLKDPDQHLDRFLAVVEELKAHLGPVLVQLPPRWSPNVDRLDAFLAAAPTRIDWAVEVRDGRWLGEELEECLRRHAAALVVHDMIADHPRTLTTDWTYCRFHGDHYRGRYGEEHLRPWADWMRTLLDQGTDVWAFFNNDENAYAVEDARLLGELLQG